MNEDLKLKNDVIEDSITKDSAIENAFLEEVAADEIKTDNSADKEVKADNFEAETQNKNEQADAKLVTPNKQTKSDDEITRKIIFSLCYLFGILFFIPLLMYKGDKKATRHANEGLVLLIFSAASNILFGILSFFIPFMGLFSGLISLALLAFGIIGVVYVCTDQDKELPLLGKIKILK